MHPVCQPKEIMTWNKTWNLHPIYTICHIEHNDSKQHKVTGTFKFHHKANECEITCCFNLAAISQSANTSGVFKMAH